MEAAAEETLTYLGDAGLLRKLLLRDKKGQQRGKDSKGHDATSDESNYVDLDVRPGGGGAKTLKVTFTGDADQLSVIKCKLFSSDSETEAQPQDAEPEPGSECSGSDELRYTDMYLNSKTESDDGASATLSEPCGSDAVEDESHYITTHEIQLTELDHDADYDLGRGTCWEFEDDNLVYSFVDYASFESDDAQGGTVVVDGRGLQANVLVTAEPEEEEEEEEEEEDSDLCDSDKCASSDESVFQAQAADPSSGEIHLSIKTSSRAVAEARIPDSSGARAGPLCDRAQYFIPAPGRQHLATKLRRKDINEYSSGASSSISELDDADKEVRNLTAKSFRSLACPYFDAINLSTSSESSVSECGLNKWSAYYGTERSATAQQSVDSPQGAHEQHRAELKDPVQSKQREVTVNFRCDVEAPKPSKTQVRRQQRGAEAAGDAHNKAVFASSLLKNVISKKMQFEHERNMERGGVRAGAAAAAGRGLQRQSSESGQSAHSADDPRPEGTAHAPEQERPKVQLNLSQSSAFNPLKAPEPEAAQQQEEQQQQDTSSMLTKLLFVPRWQLLSKEKSDLDPGLGPEIQIRLRSVKENKGCTLNIASLLTPKISYSGVNAFRAAGDARCRFFSAADTVPNVTVRNIKETKCKFQTPIYRVRDVRKLVKSSYGFVSMENKCPAAAAAAAQRVQVEPGKHVTNPATPIVIKCHSVNTKPQTGRRPSFLSRPPPELSDGAESKPLTKHRAERAAAAGEPGEAGAPKQAVIDKLKAAVKTMEQLYVFDRNEWKRKSVETAAGAGSKVAGSKVAPVANGNAPTFRNRSVLHFGNNKSTTTASSAAASVKVEPPPEAVQAEQGTVIPATATAAQGGSDSENYLAMPGQNGRRNQIHPQNQEKQPVVLEHPAVSVYHRSPRTHPPAQCPSPSDPAAPATQRKMLLDPSTGHYYLVDTPIQPTTKRLFDPETGQYVDVPVSRSPVTPVTPLPLPLSPLTLSTGAYAPAYMIYPSFVPSPSLQAPPPSSPETAKNATSPKPEAEGVYYSATTTTAAPVGGASRQRAAPGGGGGAERKPGGGGGAERKPVISITTQQGPRIIAPPSFDGTTMSFVVEHR